MGIVISGFLLPCSCVTETGTTWLLWRCVGRKRAKGEFITNAKKIAKIFLDLGIFGGVLKSFIKSPLIKMRGASERVSRDRPQQTGTSFPSFVSANLLKSRYSRFLYCVVAV